MPRLCEASCALLCVVASACAPNTAGDGSGGAEGDAARASCSIEGGEVPAAGDGSALSVDASPSESDASATLDAWAGVDASVSSDSGLDAPLGPGACSTLTTGWSRYYPTRTIQFQGAGTNDEYCTYRNDGGVEYFQLDKNPAPSIQRCEARVNNDYLTGKNEFEGDVFVTEADNMCVHQVFNFLMIVAYPDAGGEFHQHSQTFLQSGVFGRWVHVNTIHDTAAHTVQIYLDCQHVYDGADAPAPSDAGWYDKYGLYGIQGLPPQQPTSIVQWMNAAYYRQP